MREGNPAPAPAVPGRPARRFRLASSATLVLAGLTVALFAAQWPFASLAHLSVTSSTGGAQWLTFFPFGVVGFVVAWRKPRNPLGWCLLGMAVAAVFSDDGSLYAIAAYRVRHGTLPLGWVAMLAQPGWAVVIVLIGLTVLIFPDGTLPSPRLRWVLWLYLAMGLVWMVSAYVITLNAIARHDIRVDSGGNLLALDNGAASPTWWTALQDVLFVALALSLLLSLAGQVVSFRRSSGERRQQLKWLMGGFAAGLAGLGPLWRSQNTTTAPCILVHRHMPARGSLRDCSTEGYLFLLGPHLQFASYLCEKADRWNIRSRHGNGSEDAVLHETTNKLLQLLAGGSVGSSPRAPWTW
jgi:hypothetical protein